ncbi:MAG: acyltransferase [Clostridia bacterium]|nr:acyltransferase [Clostridia bacterium]
MNFTSILSKHRKPIMGVAALMIVCLHAYWEPHFLPWNILINKYGNAGVDIFVFLAGFGLAFSLEKKPAFHEYYARRLKRILPVYYAAIILKTIIGIVTGALTLSWLLASYIPLGVWIDATPQFWYVSATLGYYLIAPLLFQIFKKSRFPRITMILLIVITGVFIPIIAKTEPKAIMRIPALVTGIGIGIFQTAHVSKKDRWLDLALLAGFFSAGIVICTTPSILNLPVFSLIKRGHPARLWKVLTAPFITVAIAYVFELFEKTPARFVNALFSRLGHYSYEIYIGHMIVLYFAMDVFKLPVIGCLITMLILCYPMAILLSKAGEFLLSAAKKVPLFRFSEQSKR